MKTNWPAKIELTVFNGPEILRLRNIISDTSAIYTTADKIQVNVFHNKNGFSTQIES